MATGRAVEGYGLFELSARPEVEAGYRVDGPQVIHGPALGGAHFLASSWVDVIQPGQVEITMDEVEGQFLGKGQAAGALELMGLHGGHADLAGEAGLGCAFECNHIGQAVVLKKIRMEAAHVLTGQEGHGEFSLRHRPCGQVVEVMKYPPGIGEGNRKITATVMQVY